MNLQNNYGKNIQNALLDFFKNNKYCRQLLGFAGMIIYIYVAINVIKMLPVPSIVLNVFSYFSAILYFGCLVSLAMSYAKNDMMPVFIYFVYNAVSPLVSVLRWGFYFNNIIYILIYTALAYWAFKKCFNGTVKDVSQIDNKPVFCPHCGKPMSSSSSFCGNCGNKVK